MRPRRKSSLLWGAVGAMTFLALTQGYQLFVEPLRTDVVTILAVTLAVGGLVAGATYVLEARIHGKGRT